MIGPTPAAQDERCAWCGAPAPDDDLCDPCLAKKCAHCSERATAFGMCASCSSRCEECGGRVDVHGAGVIVLRGLDGEPYPYHAWCVDKAALELVHEATNPVVREDGLRALERFVAARRGEGKPPRWLPKSWCPHGCDERCDDCFGAEVSP